MLCIAKTASCRTFSPAAFQLRKLVAVGEIPDTAYACIAIVHSISTLCLPVKAGGNGEFPNLSCFFRKTHYGVSTKVREKI